MTNVFVDKLGFPEAPVLMPDGSFLFTEMTPDTGCITWVSRDGGARRRVARTGRPNGLTVDSGGIIWVAETLQRAVLKVTLDGRVTTFAGSHRAHPFLFLNDLAFAPNGDLYVTDSGIDLGVFSPQGIINPDWDRLDYDGRVYRVDVCTGEVGTIDTGLKFTNGIAFGPDHNLYVAETLTGMIYCYQWRDGRVVGRREPFGTTIDPDGPAGIRGPDGMKFGADGSLYVAVFGQANVTVLDPSGAVSRRIPIAGPCPTNLVFGPAGTRSIYVTEAMNGLVQRIEVDTDGLALHG